jgi:putative membrane protein
MTATQGNLASLSRFVFRAPRWYTTLTFALAIAAVSGVAAFDSAFVLDDAWQGVFFVGVPTVAASVLTPIFDQRLGGQLTHNRSSLLALTCELIVIGILTGAAILAVLTPLGQPFVFDTLLVALAAIFAFRLLIVMAVSRHRLAVAAVPASVQTVVAAALLFVYTGTLRYFEVGGPWVDQLLSRPGHADLPVVFHPQDFLLLAAMCVLYAGAVWLFLVVIDSPWQRSLGVSVLDFIQGFIGHVAEGSRELEDFFEEIGEDAVVPVTVLSFRDAETTDEKARFVLPMIHPGPMGDIGGGNLPERIARHADGLAFPPHATAGHDFNLVTEREVGRIIDAAERAHERIDYTATGTRGHRVEAGEATLTGHAFDSSALAVATFAPGFADDVEYGVGLSAIAEARNGHIEDVLLADAHNSNNGLEGPNLGHVTPGSERSFDLIEGARDLSERLADAPRSELRLGAAHDTTPWEPQEGIGPLGIRVAVLEVDDHTTAYVLIDGNNMEPGLRDRIVEAVDGVDLVEVLTSDTHVVNTMEAENQVGDEIPEDEVVALIEDLVSAAMADRERVEAGMATEKAEVTVFGNDRTETLASTANAVVSMGAALAGAFIAAVFTLSVLLFFVT